MTIGEKIREQRKKKGYSQEDLAKRVNVTRQTVGKWESGSTDPSSENIACLNAAFGCDLLQAEPTEETKKEESVVVHEIVIKIERPKRNKPKLYLALSIFFMVAAAFLGVVTFCVNMIVFSNNDGYMRVSTSPLNESHFYVFLAVTILLFVAALVFIALFIIAKKKEKQKVEQD